MYLHPVDPKALQTDQGLILTMLSWKESIINHLDPILLLHTSGMKPLHSPLLSYTQYRFEIQLHEIIHAKLTC